MEMNLMWTARGNKGKQWNKANVLVGSNQNFSVVFEAEAGDKGSSDIAIDDVTFTPECATGSMLSSFVDFFQWNSCMLQFLNVSSVTLF